MRDFITRKERLTMGNKKMNIYGCLFGILLFSTLCVSQFFTESEASNGTFTTNS
jgi:hypothetical protein